MQRVAYSFLTLKRELNRIHNTNEARLTIKTFFKIKRKLAKLKTSKVKKTVWCTSINNAKYVICCMRGTLESLKLWNS